MATKKTKKKATRKKAPARRKKVKGGKVGQKPFEPDDKQRQQVTLLMGLSLTFREIATCIINPQTQKGIGINTLQKHFRQELDWGLAKVKGQVLSALVRHAVGKGPGAVAACIFIAKTRYGYRETAIVEHKGVGVMVAPASVTPQKWIEDQQGSNRLRPMSSSGDVSRN